MEKQKYSPEELASIAKERPENETDKRFVVSHEEFSKQRLEAVHEEVDEMKSKYPEVLSLCMFGSMVKGTAHEGSDIDGYLFIDSEIVAQKQGISEEDVIEKSTIRNASSLKDQFAKQYTTEFRRGIQERTGLEEKDVKDIKSRPISEKIIDREIQVALEYEIAKEKYESEKKGLQAKDLAWMRSRPPRGSSVDVLLEYEKNRPKYPKLPDHVMVGVDDMFHLDVGGGIRKYRKMFIDKLVALGPIGDKVWENTIIGTEMLENNLSRAPSKRYPRNLAEAVEVYGK